MAKKSMKEKLLALDLSEKVVDEILNIFGLYQQSLEAYSKPAGPKNFRNRIEEIEGLARELSEKLKELTEFERQHLFVGVDTRDTAKRLHFLASCCGFVKQKNVQGSFRKTDPFTGNLGLNIKEALEKHDIPVKVYSDNVFCKVINILLKQENGSTGFNLLRRISK